MTACAAATRLITAAAYRRAAAESSSWRPPRLVGTMRAMTLSAALDDVERTFRPASWDVTYTKDEAQPEKRLLRRFGALPQTMHFGLMEVDLAASEVRFIDQDHRDGGDFLVHRAPLPPDWSARLSRLLC